MQSCKEDGWKEKRREKADEGTGRNKGPVYKIACLLGWIFRVVRGEAVTVIVAAVKSELFVHCDDVQRNGAPVVTVFGRKWVLAVGRQSNRANGDTEIIRPSRSRFCLSSRSVSKPVSTRERNRERL